MRNFRCAENGVQFLTDSDCFMHDTASANLLIKYICIPEIMQVAYVTVRLCHCSLWLNFTVRFSQISGFMVYFQADLQRQTVSWLWWPPVSTTSVSTVWYPTVHCTGSTPRSPLLLIRYRIIMISPGVFYFDYHWCWTTDHVTSSMLQPGHR